MPIVFRSALSSTVANNTFLDKTIDDIKKGQLTLYKITLGEADQIDDVQVSLNEIFDIVGSVEGDANALIYATNNIITDGNNHKEALEAFDVQVQQNLSDIETLQTQILINNLDATEAPTVNNDETEDYSVGSFWYNQDTNILYIAEDVTTGAAVWQAISGAGGDSQVQTNYSILDNQSVATDVTGLAFNSSNVKSVTFKFDLSRRDDTQNTETTGEITITYDNENSTWLSVKENTYYDVSGVTFTIDGTGQLQYTSTNFGGANYSGTLRIFDVQEIAQVAEISQEILDNTANEDIVGQVYDLNNVSAVFINIDIERRDDAQFANETGKLILKVDTENDLWLTPKPSTYYDDAGITFNITAGGQLQYTSTNFGGANYSGTLRITNIDIIERVA